jgi:5-hydroxyisourate hydrolase
MSGISTHILDTGLGRPAAGVAVTLERWKLDAWLACGSGITDGDGRCKGLLPAEHVSVGRYRLNFATGEYFAGDRRHTFFPEVTVTFEVEREGGSYHVPLLLSGFGYSTYRGS